MMHMKYGWDPRFSEQVSHPWTVLGPQGGDILAHSTTSDSVLLGTPARLSDLSLSSYLGISVRANDIDPCADLV